MNPQDIIAVIILSSIFVAIVARRIINRKRGKGSCSCGCGNCAMSESCHERKTEKEKSENLK
ncbi:MAG: FeoB-associated Cys-rich membrane protein [Lachnospiraceae bacterium]|nr:FeoB-associated Cys-rich membrane protein [Lachnospiraceae bacterium]